MKYYKKLNEILTTISSNTEDMPQSEVGEWNVKWNELAVRVPPFS